MRLTKPSCSFIVTPTQTDEFVQFSLENVDPDTVIVTPGLTGILNEPTTFTVEPWYQVQDDLWFVALSDNQARGTIEANPVFEDIVPLVDAINPPFMTNSGDLIQGSTDPAILPDMFQSVLDTLTDTTVPMYPVPGNHDYDENLVTYSSYFGSPDYGFDIGPARLVALSTAGSTSRGRVTTEQINWLDNMLASTSLQTIVYFHHPIITPAWGKTACCFENNTERDHLATALSTYSADLVINGHSQGYDYQLLSAGLYQIITGGAGGRIAQPDGEQHFVLVHVTPTEVSHIMFPLADTALAFDQTNNSGQYTQAKITSEYTGLTDLPYLRLKFKLQYQPDATYVVYDDQGNILPYQSQVYDDEIILLAQTQQIKNTTVIYTAQALFQVTPSNLTTQIHRVKPVTSGYSWVERPFDKTVDTTYQLNHLSGKQEVKVYVNGHLRRNIPVKQGQATFTLFSNVRRRHVIVIYS
ncbi:MAG: metallophosphoesterase [Patescibacteria group bacterium]